jgi:uncharacterized cupredoxin-like copper-binding protein
MRTRMLLPTIGLIALAVLVAGCGGDDSNDSGSSGGGNDNSSGAYGNDSDTNTTSSSSGGGGGAKLKLTADPDGALKFDKQTLTAKAGKVTVVMNNPSDVPHAVEIEGNGVEKESKTVTGASSDVTADLKAGKYEFYCPVDGHRQAGMEGTLTVN